LQCCTQIKWKYLNTETLRHREKFSKILRVSVFNIHLIPVQENPNTPEYGVFNMFNLKFAVK
jgi:hypothetical protein